MTLRVLFLTQYYPPETGAPQVRISEMARSLTAQGFTVEVLTSLPSYPVGRIHNGYRRRLSVVEQHDGIRVIRTLIYPTRSISMARRLLNYLSFVASSLFFGLPRVRRPDVIVCESPPLFLGLAALVMKRVFRARLVFNVSDLWPDSVVHMGVTVPRGMVRLARGLERVCYRSSDVKTGQSPTIVCELRRRDDRPVVLISNGCDTDRFTAEQADRAFRVSFELDGHLVVGYAGLLGAAQGVGILLDVAQGTSDDDRIRYVIVGDGPEREVIAREAARRELSNVVLAGHQSSDRMPGIVSAFDIAFIPLRVSLPGALPSKIYEAMASEVPVLLAADGDPRDLVERSESGIVVNYENLETIVDAVRLLASDPELRERLGRNGRNYVLHHRQRKVIAERMGQVIEMAARRDEDGLRALEDSI